MANTFSFEDALKPAPQVAPQQGANTFSFEDAMQPAAPQQQQPTTFSFEEAMQAPEQPKFIDARGQKPPEPRPEDQSFLRGVADVPLNVAQGAVSGIRMIADSFGANSGASKALRGAEDYLGDLMSAQAKQDKQEVARIMKEAEDKGFGDQVMAGVKALAVAPVDTVSNALGTSAPTIAAGLATLLLGAPTAAVVGVSAGVGTVMGAGTIKSAIYDATKDELTKLGLPKDEVEKRAEAAQAYDGKNLDQIVLGSVLGGVASFGFETAAIEGAAARIMGKVAATEAAEKTAVEVGKQAAEKGVTRRVAEHAVKEAVPEAAQGSQEQLAQNLALQREGFDVPTMRGVISHGVLEGLAAAPLGGYAGYKERAKAAATNTKEDRLISELDALSEEEEMTVPAEQQGLTDEELASYESLKNTTPTGSTEAKLGTTLASIGDVEGAPTDTTAGVTATPEGAGLAVPSTPVEGLGVGEAVQPSALTPLQAARAELRETEQKLSQDPNATVEEFDAAQAKYDAVEKAEFDKVRDIVHANAQSAIDQVDNYDYGGDAQKAFDSYEDNAITTLHEEGITDPELFDYAFKEFKKEKERLLGKSTVSEEPTSAVEEAAPLETPAAEPAQVEAPAQDIATLEKEADDAHTVARQIEAQMLGMLTKAGRIPAKNSPKRAQYDALATQFDAAKQAVIDTDNKLAKAKKKPLINNAPNMSMEEGERALEAQFTNVAETNMSPFVVEMINRNDVNGALRAISSRVRGFYGELAARLLDLNLSTSVYIGRQSTALQQLITSEVGPQMTQIAQYMQSMFPNSGLTNTIKNHLNDDGSGKNIVDVYNALIDINSNTPNLNGDVLTKAETAPIIMQLKDALRVYGEVETSLSAPGFYIDRFNLVNINPNIRDGMTYRTFLHEIVHAATESLLNADPSELTQDQLAAREELKKLFEIAKRQGPIGEYGLTNISEFITELFTNSHFRNELKKIPYPQTKTNLLTKFVEAIMKLVGMDNLAGRSMLAAERMFTSQRFGQGANFKINMAKKGSKRIPKARGVISTPGEYLVREDVSTGFFKLLKEGIQGRRSWDEVIRIAKPSLWNPSEGKFRRALLGFANLRQIADITKAKFPQLQSAIGIIERMLDTRAKIMSVASDTVNKWQTAINTVPNGQKQSQLMGRIMVEVTTRGVEVDPKGKGYKAEKVNPKLKEAWDALDPKFHEIYREVRKFYEDSVDRMVNQLKEQAKKRAGNDKEKLKEEMKKINDMFGPDKMVRPYFPLRRFGDYWFQFGKGRDKKFFMFESEKERDLAMNTYIEDMKKKGPLMAGLTDTIEKGVGIKEVMSKNGTDETFKAIQKMLSDVEQNATTVPEATEQIRDATQQLIFLMLPQQSMRKMFINRKGVQGASSDMLRVFATTSVHGAYQFSRMAHADDFLNNISAAENYIKTMPGTENRAMYNDYVNEVRKRSNYILGNEDTSMAAKVAGKLSESTFYFMLSAPFTSMLNVLGFAQITMPYIGSAYGYDKAAAAIGKNFLKYGASSVGRTFKPLAKGQMHQVSFPSIVEGGKLEGKLAEAAKRFLDEGQMQISQTNDLMEMGERPTELYTGRMSAVKRTLSGLFHQSERLNREVTLLTVFELAYEKYQNEPKKDARGIIERDPTTGEPLKYTEKEAFDKAIDDAKEMAGMTLGDFTRQMKPRYFVPPLMSVLSKFKQYPVLATYTIFRNLYLSLGAPFSQREINDTRELIASRYIGASGTREEIQAKIDREMNEFMDARKQTYKEARRRLAGIMGMTFLFGGIEAQPFFSLILAPIIKMFGDDDDDEFFNWENWFRNYMEEELGGAAGALFLQAGLSKETAEKAGRKTGEAFGRGVVPAVTGASLTERVSLDPKNLWYREGRYSPDLRESLIENVIANAGPVVGLGVNWVEAYKLMQEGQMQRAFEKAAPAIVSKPVTAARLATEGATTKSGQPIADDFTATEIAMQAIGLQPERLAQAQKAAIEVKQDVQKIQDRRTALLNRLWMERNDPEAFKETLDEAVKFSIRHPGAKIDGNTITESFKKRQQDMAIANVVGANVPKKLIPEVINMGKYGRE